MNEKKFIQSTKKHLTTINPYDYVVENMTYYSKKQLKHSMDYLQLCSCLRRYNDWVEYDLNYWNTLFQYFLKKKDNEFKPFSSYEELIYSMSVEGILEQYDNI